MALSAARNDNKAAVVEAVGRRSFPPRLVYPEEKVDDMQLSRPFSLVESVECKCDLVFVKCRCAVTGSYFSIVSSDYFAQWSDMIFHFPFVLSQKLVFSNSLMEMVHDGITAQDGLQRTMANMERRRKQRYYKLLGLFSSGIKRNHERCFTYLAPTPISEDQYADQNKVVDNHTLTTAWLHAIELYGSLCEKVMKDCVVKRVMRMDHSVKFCKRLKLRKAKGQRESLKDARMLLLFQNEIGQIIGRRPTRSENKEETRALLQHVKSQFRAPSIGSEVVTKQDPFHVITRITEK
ncbi:hypothetical protein PHYSODRAFT_530031 [Phytophthora sojae]|uniref:Uncharacterized protein n=1 Tax=Phytophthora sojae (strain P6497) TaxID=1094619 RepID=G5ABQ3_PHYSP|nr:hypothetical protein PHYSODRAFT_530031 [Phytophthora sojae]EGZ06778.1 hypothetical protein PHYSODRAFT_530031 [Phytophthora sojae]|eukprot:XP_009537542.1 hypothetical protein PHYSODRAFT_530031 [Phytophthora sojae]